MRIQTVYYGGVHQMTTYDTTDIDNADRLARVETKIDTILATMINIDRRIEDIDCRVRVLENDKQFSKGQYAVLAIIISIFAVVLGGWLTNLVIMWCGA